MSVAIRCSFTKIAVTTTVLLITFGFERARMVIPIRVIAAPCCRHTPHTNIGVGAVPFSTSAGVTGVGIRSIGGVIVIA